jgi:hypothetical protein
MDAPQPVRVQCLPPERNRSQRVAAVDVPLLPDQHMPAQPRLDPDLIAAAGAQPDFDQ